MPHRLTLALLVAISTVAGSLVAQADGAPTMLPNGTWAIAPYAGVAPAPTGTLRAGAASGDISPPVGSPMTSFYVGRNCPAGAAIEAAVKANDKIRQIQEDPTEAPYAPSQCTAAPLGPDTDGYAKLNPASQGRYGRLRAQSFVIDDGERKVAIVSVDLPAIFGEMHDAVANRIADIGIPRDDLLISASHTHTGPGGYFQQNLAWATIGGDALDPRIFEAITSGIANAVRLANARLQPAKLAAGESLVQLNGNRRGAQWLYNPEAQLGIDPRNAPRLGMIRLDAADGTPIGVITNYSTHGVIGNIANMWQTGDDKAWVGRLVEAGIRAEANLPADHPIVDTTLNGAQGDIGTGSCTRPFPMDGADFRDFICMESAGARQAAEYLTLWRSLGSQLRDDVTVDARFDMVCFCGQEVADDPYDPFDRGTWVPVNDDPKYFNVGITAIQGEGRAPATIFPGHHRRQPLLIATPGGSPKNVRIQVLRVGNTAFASMPGEPTITMGRRVERSVKAALAGIADNVWVAGLGNDHNAYFATIQEYEAYMYEGGWSFYGQQTGNLLKRRLVDLATWMAGGEPVPACTEERNCVNNPDTSDLSAEPEPFVIDPAPEIFSQPADVERFVGTNFAWHGGGPSAEWRPTQAAATLQRRIDGVWTDVASDLDPVIPLRYGKRYGRHRFTALFDPVADQPVGTYRFVVNGAYATAPRATTPYSLTSREFEIVPSTKLRLVKTGSTWAVEQPEPDRLRNYRWRARNPVAWSVSGELDGAPFSATDAFSIPAGSTLVVPAGGITDSNGNTNGAAITITG